MALLHKIAASAVSLCLILCASVPPAAARVTVVPAQGVRVSLGHGGAAGRTLFHNSASPLRSTNGGLSSLGSPTLPAFRDQLPYNVIDVLTEEGLHFQSQLLDCPPDEIEAGMRVEAVFVPATDEITLVKFRPVGR